MDEFIEMVRERETMDGGGTFFRIKLNFMENQAGKKNKN